MSSIQTLSLPTSDNNQKEEEEEWINEEKETISELKRGAIAAQFPQDFSVDSDFLSQPNNVWLPARLHPEISPGDFQDWLEKHETQNIKVNQGVTRKKSLLRYSSKNLDLLDSTDASAEDSQYFNSSSLDQSSSIDSTLNINSSLPDEFPNPRLFPKTDKPKPSLKRSKLVNKRRDTSSRPRRGKIPIPSSSDSCDSTQFSSSKNVDQNGNWQFSLAELSLAEDPKSSSNQLSRKLSTAKILEHISKEVSDMSFEDLGFDGVQTSFSPNSSFVDSVTKISDSSLIASNPDFSKDLEIDLNSPLDKKSFSKSTNNQSTHPIKSSKSLSSTYFSSKKDKNAEPELPKKHILPSAMSFLRFGKSKSSSVGSTKTQKKESAKNAFDSLSKKSSGSDSDKKKDSSSVQPLDYSDMPSFVAENLMMPDQASRYPNVLTPIRPQPTIYKFTQTRFPIHIERAIYRLASIKLTNPRRPLYQKVLLTNMMYWYLELINPKSFQPTSNLNNKKPVYQKSHNLPANHSPQSNITNQVVQNSSEQQNKYYYQPQAENSQLYRDNKQGADPRNIYYGPQNYSNNNQRKQPLLQQTPLPHESSNQRPRSPSSYRSSGSDSDSSRTSNHYNVGMSYSNNNSRESLVRKKSKKSGKSSRNLKSLGSSNKQKFYNEKQYRGQPNLSSSGNLFMNDGSTGIIDKSAHSSQNYAQPVYSNNQPRPNNNFNMENSYPSYDKKKDQYKGENIQSYPNNNSTNRYPYTPNAKTPSTNPGLIQPQNHGSYYGSSGPTTNVQSSLTPTQISYYQQQSFRQHSTSPSPSLPSQSAELSVNSTKIL
ncbi:Protein zds1 [Smittium culicis]|uniref:Protein zds1 n=1 Tax=Smittium culicis TaxID=133412 RepID=A0A1R1X328_9FUNG|nr:Protein zds1 [Smittium culicis]